MMRPAEVICRLFLCAISDDRPLPRLSEQTFDVDFQEEQM